MKQKFLLKLGAFAFLGAMGLNLQYAWADYGITEHPLHVEVLAQSNESGDEGGTTGSGGLWERKGENCTITVTGTANAETVILGIKVKFDADGVGSLTVCNAATYCAEGGKEQCKFMSCGEFWIAAGLGTR